jgi:translation elongation factor EF-1beta
MFENKTSREELSEEEYLRKHLESVSQRNDNPNTSTFGGPDRQNNYGSVESKGDLLFVSFPVNEFPCSILYPPGTIIQVRPATVKEVQAYSMVDDNNFYDIIEKMNEILSSCVKIKYPDGTVGSYLEIKDADRYYLIFLIRELSFQKGSSLTTTATCECGNEVSIELKRSNFVFYELDDRIKQFFDPSRRSLYFDTINGNSFSLSPPTIGLQKSFTEYIVKINSEKKKLNLSFLKIIPFLLPDKKSISISEIENQLKEYEKMDDISFQFLNSAVGKVTFGIEKLKMKCSCGIEGHTDMIFPDGASTIFVVHDAFDRFIKK